MSHPAPKIDAAKLDLVEPTESCLRAPPLPDGSVHRTALVNRLRTERVPLVLLTAPAGYGKSTALAQWSRRDPRPFAWVRPVGECDGVTLLRLLVESVSRLAPVDDEIALPLGARPLRIETVARRLGKWLLERSEPFVLAVDGTELLTQDAADVLATLAEHVPPQAQLVVSGRRLPLLPLPRYRVQRTCTEITEVDLRFTDREAAKLFAGSGLVLDEVDVDELNERAEGWPTGLTLAAMALEPRHGHPQRSLAGFSGAHELVADFFAAEVLDRLDPADFAFSVEASLFEQLSGPACDAVLGTRGSGDRLLRLAHEGTFVVPLDREHRGYRFHRLYRDALLVHLEQCEPARFAELSRSAAAWAEREGDIVGAIEYLRGVGEHGAAAGLLGAAGPDVCRGLLTELERALVDLGDEQLLVRHQAAAVVGALAHALLGHPAAAARWAAVADEAKPEGPLVDGTKRSTTWLKALHAALCRDGVERMAEDAAAALDGLPAHSPVHAFALLCAGVAQRLRGDMHAAAAAFDAAIEEARGAGAALVLATALAELSLLAQERSEWSRAEELARGARDAAESLDDTNAVCALVYAASARSALRNSNWVRVSDDLARVHTLLPQLTEALPWLSAQVRLELARTHLALNDLAAVRELLTEIDVLLLDRPHLGVVRDEALRLREEVERLLGQTPGACSSLTAAELRLLPLLTTYLTFRQIADHLYVSRNTIKTQAISVYRKLGVSSRAEAIERANELGFLRPSETVERREP
jgi:LuxR family transcriptional regulator, maltose regulon positive regulatory protein